MGTTLLGYDQIESAARLAAVASEHLLLISAPGRAKSLFARSFFLQYEGAAHFIQLTRESTEIELVGPPNLKKLREIGELDYSARDITRANWLYIDEIFDARDALLRVLNSLLHERELRGRTVALRSCIATANYTRVNELTEAVIDRFLLNVPVPDLTRSQRAALYDGVPFESPARPESPTSLAELDDISARAAEVKISPVFIDALLDYCAQCNMTPRRERKLARLLKHNAALANRSVVDESDLNVLAWCQPAAAEPIPVDGVKESIARAMYEQQQLATLAGCETRIDIDVGSDSDRTLDNLRALSKVIKDVVALHPVSDQVASVQLALRDRFARTHQELAVAMGVMP